MCPQPGRECSRAGYTLSNVCFNLSPALTGYDGDPMNWLLIALGGAVGSVARYGTSTLLLDATDRTQFPWGTVAANLIGCLLIGYLNGLLIDQILPAKYRFLLVIGF